MLTDKDKLAQPGPRYVPDPSSTTDTT